MFRREMTTHFFAAFVLAVTPHVMNGQSVDIGNTELSLGMSAEDAVRKLAKEFRLTPNHGKFQTWWIAQALPHSTYQFRGQIVAFNGKLTSINKILTPDRPTAASVGEAFFMMLDRLASDAGQDCRVKTARKGVESGPGAGGTLLTATIECPHYDGNLTVYQGSDSRMTREPAIAFRLKSPTP